MLRIVIGILPDFGIMALLLQFYIVLKEIAASLDEESNPVIMLIKHKK